CFNNKLAGYLADEYKYPEAARSLGVEGKIYVNFVVESDGSISNVTVVKGLDALLDAEAIRAKLTSDATVLVIGAGWIGLEVAAAARKRGATAIVVELADRVCARALTPEMSQWIHDLHLRNGVDIRCGVSFDHFEGDGGLRRAIMADGSVIDCNIAVVGIGLTPNVELAAAAGLDVDNGIVVDERGQTSHPDIYAAGDNANHPNSLLGRRIRLESWENAQNQAICAAKAMLGGEDTYAEIPWFWSDQFDANIQMMGLPEDWNETVVRGDRNAGEFVEFYLKDGKLEGAAAINNPRDLRFTRRMMMSDKTFNASDLADPDVKLQKLLKG
ncbi:MAG: TonB family protein, partial [Alphaproteobacteria bacterium]|nr:TonB family protein [Alphaproteobacteria bacterium]